MKTALICRAGGQSGVYLSRLLLEKRSPCFWHDKGRSRRLLCKPAARGVRERVSLLSMAPEDFRSVFMALKACQPDEVYFLAGQSSVRWSFEQHAETIESFTLGTLNVLEACRMMDKSIRQYHAGSSECFGDTAGVPANEATPFSPRSPYAVAKASAYWLVNNCREAHGLYACTGILFNHESPLRPNRFVTRKIVDSAVRIANGSGEKLSLGRLNIVRDWGWAPEYVDAMWRMLQQEAPADFVIATGVSVSLEDFVRDVFLSVGMDWREHVESDPKLFRPSDINWSQGDASLVKACLGWEAQIKMPELAKFMVETVRNP